jgi:lipoprotein-anchoring transpeptidase ErfK/SrfK
METAMTNLMITRRRFVSGSAAVATLGLAGCQTAETTGDGSDASAFRAPPTPSAPEDAEYALMYAAVSDGGFNLPAVPWQKINPRFLRQTVSNSTGVGAGKLVVETSRHHLYYTLPFGRAVRYGVGLGREGFEWTGAGDVHRKAQWPKWHPPEEMIERQPELEKYRTTYDRKNDLWLGGMNGGPSNPLGARALYIFQGGKDTQYRLHGSPEWNSIGKSVSSGCVRMINQDVMDLYNRVPEGTPVIVR